VSARVPNAPPQEWPVRIGRTKVYPPVDRSPIAHRIVTYYICFLRFPLQALFGASGIQRGGLCPTEGAPARLALQPNRNLNNRIWRQLPAHELIAIEPTLTHVELKHETVLRKPNSTIKHVCWMICSLIGIFVLACGGILALAGERPASHKGSTSAAMRFEWHLEGPADQCGAICRTWISAIGVIVAETAREFETFASNRDVRSATLVLDSEGGSVLAAIALGRAVRSLHMTTAVGKTIMLPYTGDGQPRARVSANASCESMCAFVLLGGARRYVPAGAQVLVHQIWPGAKNKQASLSTYSAKELDVVQRDIGRLARYTVEMGGGIELLDKALQFPPWEPMHSLSAEEMRRTGLTTTDRLFEPAVPAAKAAPVFPNSSLATTGQLQRARD
jgi:hypothetical protein